MVDKSIEKGIEYLEQKEIEAIMDRFPNLNKKLMSNRCKKWEMTVGIFGVIDDTCVDKKRAIKALQIAAKSAREEIQREYDEKFRNYYKFDRDKIRRETYEILKKVVFSDEFYEYYKEMDKQNVPQKLGMYLLDFIKSKQEGKR